MSWYRSLHRLDNCSLLEYLQHNGKYYHLMIFMYIDEGGTMYFEVFSYENLGNMEIVFWAIMADYMCC